MNEPRITECWTIPMALSQENPSVSNIRAATFDDSYRPAVLMWREDYDKLRAEVEAARREGFEAGRKRVNYAHESEYAYYEYADYVKSRE